MLGQPVPALYVLGAVDKTLGSGSYAHVYTCLTARVMDEVTIPSLRGAVNSSNSVFAEREEVHAQTTSTSASQRWLAVKETKPDTGGLPHMSAVRECAALSLMHGVPGIPPVRGVGLSETDCTLQLAMPVYGYCLLKQKECRARQLPVEFCKCFARTIVNALANAHVCGLTHRDIKPENIMFQQSPEKAAEYVLSHTRNQRHERRINNENQESNAEAQTRSILSDAGVVLIDWGLSRQSPTSRAVRSPYVVTRWYRAPEILLGFTDYGPPSDMWALGVTLAEVITGNVLFPGRDQLHQLHLIFSRIGAPRKTTWPAALRMLKARNMSFKQSRAPTNVLCSDGAERRDVIDSHASGSDAQQAVLPLANRRYEQGAMHIPSLPQDAEDFIARCLTLDPNKRITAIEALSHPFLTTAFCQRQRQQHSTGPALSTCPPSRLDAMSQVQHAFALNYEGMSEVWKSNAKGRAQLLDWLVEVHHHLKQRSLALPAAIHMIQWRYKCKPYPSGHETAGVVAISALILCSVSYGASHMMLDTAAKIAGCTEAVLRMGMNHCLRASVLSGGSVQPTWLHFLDAAAEAGVLFGTNVTVPSHDHVMPLQSAYTIARFAAESAAVLSDATLSYSPSTLACAALHVAVWSHMPSHSPRRVLEAACSPIKAILGPYDTNCVKCLIRCMNLALTSDMAAVRNKYVERGNTIEWLVDKQAICALCADELSRP